MKVMYDGLTKEMLDKTRVDGRVRSKGKKTEHGLTFLKG